MRFCLLLVLAMFTSCDQSGSESRSGAAGLEPGAERERGIVEVFRTPAAEELNPTPASDVWADPGSLADDGWGGEDAQATGPEDEPGEPAVSPEEQPSEPALSPACMNLCDELVGAADLAQCAGEALSGWGYPLEERCAGALAGANACADCLTEVGVTSPDCSEVLMVCESTQPPPLDGPGPVEDPQQCVEQVCTQEINSCFSNEGCYSLLVCLQDCSTEACQYTCIENSEYLAQDLFFYLNDCAICSGCYGEIAPEDYCF